MNTTSSSVSSALLAAPYQLNMWLGLFIWGAGNLGSIGNMIVFSSRTFRKRAYSVYLLSEAMSDFIYFDFLLLTRVLQKGFQIPITTRYDVLCKLRQFVSVWSHQVSFNLFSFATIDRLLSAQRSNTYRQWSNRVRLAYIMSITCVLFWLLFIGHRLILYSTSNGKCGPLTGFYAYFDNYIEVVFTAICTPIIMVILAYLLIKSVRDVIQRRIVPDNNVAPITVTKRSVLQQIDSRLTFMLILQSIIAITTYTPYAAELIYTNITQYWPKSPLQLAIEKVIVEFIHLVSYTFFATSFYVSLISNSGFRRQFQSFFRKPKPDESTIHINTILRTNTMINIEQK
ncbi:unnamed protein product [Rotaria sp. Silwood1]|nr:unnamed protein product [Rotaria sp. Silwood1]CAF1288894.1 unnamed protein product [Rotaria sp. Silwood1]CAF3527048.1 unnamed protein product [Rotaria sp. Silwood1]CAF3573227.1 unnamed protein product [Rotaria sp. Silwood1]CAF4519525.1 unnamed protein product [Rotaria sp. Silwood1]